MIKHLDKAYLDLEKRIVNYGTGRKGTRVKYATQVCVQKHRPFGQRYVRIYKNVSGASQQRVERLIHKMDWM